MYNEYRIHEEPSRSESILEPIRPFIHLPRIESNRILRRSIVFVPNIFSSSKVNHPVAPILAIPTSLGCVHRPLSRERSDWTWLSEDVAFVDGSVRPCGFVESIEEAGAFLSGYIGELSKNLIVRKRNMAYLSSIESSSKVIGVPHFSTKRIGLI